MNNIYILAGEEFLLKQEKIESIKKDRLEWNYKKLVLQNSKAESLNAISQEAFMYLTTIDMFNLNNKILNISVDSSKLALEILKELIDDVGENILIIDINSTDLRSLTSNSVYKKNTSKIELEKYSKLEEKNRKIIISQIKDIFDEKKLKFKNNYDKDVCANYIFDSSNYSYSFIKQQIEQLAYFADEILEKEDIYEFISESFNGNFFILINKMFSCKTKIEFINLIEANINLFNKSEYISFFNIFTYTLKDYLRFISGSKCKNGSNYYQFLNSKLRINNAEELILSIAELNFKCRISNESIQEELLILLYKYIDEK